MSKTMSSAKKQISTDLAPSAIGPYSQAIEIDGFLFASGQIPITPETGNIESDDISEQTHRVMKNIKAVLAECGVGFDAVVKTTVFLTDLNDFAAVNKIYGEYFTEPYPARSCIQVAALPKGAKIEAEIVAKVK